MTTCASHECPIHGAANRAAYQAKVRDLREYREQQADWWEGDEDE